MRQAIMSLVFLLLLSLGTVMAQDNTVVMVDDTTTSYWVGVSGGFTGGFGGAFHFGLENAISEGTDLRINAILQSDAFGVGVDALVDVGIDLDVPIDVYAGAGVFGAFGSDSNTIAVNGLVGGEYRLTELELDALGIFFEVGPALLITPEFSFGVVGSFGFNFHF
jgi:hypothetical protein